MDENKLKPYKLDIALLGYMPIPREPVSMDIPSTAILIYAALLDRATLSQKNHYADDNGWVYVIYPIENLAEIFHISDTVVKRHLRELESRKLIHRRREVKNGPNYIYLNLPAGSIRNGSDGTKPTDQRAKKAVPTGRKVPLNNKRKQQNLNDYYQRGEDESL